MEIDKENESSFLAALANDDQAEIIRLFPDQEFILLEAEAEPDDASSDSEGEEKVTAMIAEVEDYSALILFTSAEMVDMFAEHTDLFEDEEGIPSFVLNGRQLMDMLPADTGLLFNPESDECFVMSPTVFESFREDMN
jgi:hypothetical protein